MITRVRATAVVLSALVAVATAVPGAAAPTTARQRLDALVDSRSPSSTSVAVLDLTANRAVIAGARSGMVTASVAKLELLETLLLARQSAHRRASHVEHTHLAAMIEHSSNADADWVFARLGGRAGVRAWEHRLGLRARLTRIGHDGHWGLTTTSAGQQLALLRNLVSASSPLKPGRRAYALRLMRQVEADQRWGVPPVATSGVPANKNGWLGVGEDHYRWAVNSVGVVTVSGHLLLVAVMTQHDRSFAGGVARVERLARAAVAAVR